MPWILAIESSTPRASLALLRESRVIFERSFESDRNHNAAMFAPLQEALAALESESLDAVIIGTGPGSYSGTRVGIAAGQGVAMVHACPAVGLSSLLAAGVAEGVAVGDARRGSAWWAEITPGKLPQPAMLPTEALEEQLVGTGQIFTFEDLEKLSLPNEITVQRLQPNAVLLAEAWLDLPQAARDELSNVPPQPAYLRPPHVTAAKQGHPLLRPGRSER
ncbi:tRNA (adenosine(37)-N6)-threonylcarbamoyltransferase complex dimerization subunit type 1 TsaB [Haloferula sp.]|uniref:tRNA (adenosine(37)-N6)-threonylcarbamoyltransferase complex dimerization subunit type 1 TsaB n=1 Tax=Haloferula sp. TaxID=2497595 RepID=UPI003C7555EE